jgi:hypothetical protein
VAAAIVAALGLGVAASRAEDDAQDVGELTKEAKAVLNGGLKYLADPNQQGDEGDVRAGNTTGSLRLATTSLAGLAWLAGGSTPTRGPYSDNVMRALQYVLRTAWTQGEYVHFGHPGENEGGRMHAHGFAMLFLAESYGMLGGEKNKRLADEVRAALKGAVSLSIASQTKQKGGWGYAFAGEPAFGAEMDEASTTITQLQGLRAARNAGISVGSKTIERAIKYVKKCVKAKGDCCYSLSMAEGDRTSFELTAAAVSTLNAAGMYKSGELDLALGYMRRECAKKKYPTEACEQYYFYGNLYAAQAMFQSGGPDWASWWKGAQEDLVAKARRETADEFRWDEPHNFGECYATASACLILALPLRYLPIFER